MALYTILFGLSIFMIALVLAIIKKMYYHWKEEQKIERMVVVPDIVDRPAVSLIIYTDKCVIRRRLYPEEISVYDVIDKANDVEIVPPAIRDSELAMNDELRMMNEEFVKDSLVLQKTPVKTE